MERPGALSVGVLATVYGVTYFGLHADPRLNDDIYVTQAKVDQARRGKYELILKTCVWKSKCFSSMIMARIVSILSVLLADTKALVEFNI